jgi:hypothetical protein
VKENVFFFFLIEFIIFCKNIFVFRVLNYVFAFQVRMGKVVKQPSIEELVDGLTVVRKDHFIKFSDNRLYHWWVGRMVGLLEDSIYWKEQIFCHDERDILAHFTSNYGLIKLNDFNV